MHLRVNLGTEVIAPPGAHTVTPLSPSMVGPRLVHVYGVAGNFSLKLLRFYDNSPDEI